ncbi:MAG TPA: formimidoylglutamate deiminase [Pyrinomonadaceae bacterium]
MIKPDSASRIAWLPDFIYAGSRFESGRALVCDASGTIVGLPRAEELRDEKRIRLANRAMLPSMVNAHSHAFQRVLRGRTEYRTSDRDSFWTWREMMYSAATRLTPEDVYDASRMAFLEMALSGITSVGEFHYLHHAPDGKPYDDPNLLAKEVIRAAGDVGLRIALLRVAYVRAGLRTEPNPRQTRFIEADADVYLQRVEELVNELNRGDGSARLGRANSSKTDSMPEACVPTAWIGVAPHSVRAVPLEYLREVIGHANELNLKVHMHLAEQPAEVSACVEEYGRTPVALLETEGLLSERFTAVHAIHVTPKAMPAFARTGAMVCACPTTERNLGDGVVPADEYLKHGVPICLGTDSHVQIDPFEEARELEYHLRLQRMERAILGARTPSSAGPAQSELAAFLFDCATVNGARSIGSPNGTLDPGKPADFFTVDLSDPSIAGASPDDLLSSIMFSASRAAVREVAVGGKPIVSDGQHLIQEEVVERFFELQKRLWE